MISLWMGEMPIVNGVTIRNETVDANVAIILRPIIHIGYVVTSLDQ